MAARLAGSRQIGQANVKSRSSEPPRTCKRTRVPRCTGTAVRAGNASAASRFAPCWVVDFSPDGSFARSAYRISSSGSQRNPGVGSWRVHGANRASSMVSAAVNETVFLPRPRGGGATIRGTVARRSRKCWCPCPKRRQRGVASTRLSRAAASHIRAAKSCARCRSSMTALSNSWRAKLSE